MQIQFINKNRRFAVTKFNNEKVEKLEEVKPFCHNSCFTSELCCPGAKPQISARHSPTRFGVLLQYNEVLIFLDVM